MVIQVIFDSRHSCILKTVQLCWWDMNIESHSVPPNLFSPDLRESQKWFSEELGRDMSPQYPPWPLAEVSCKSWFERIRNSVPPLYLLSYQANGDWIDLSIISVRNIFATTWTLSMQCFDSIAESSSEKHEEDISNMISYDLKVNRKGHPSETWTLSERGCTVFRFYYRTILSW